MGNTNYPWSDTNYPWSDTNYPWSDTNYPWSDTNYPWSDTNYPWSDTNYHSNEVQNGRPSIIKEKSMQFNEARKRISSAVSRKAIVST
jgi:hypothetical protein